MFLMGQDTWEPPDVGLIPDPNLEEAIRQSFDPPLEGDILTSDLLELTGLDADNMGIEDLTGLEYCSNLTYLDLWNNQVTDRTPLAGLTNLTYLRLDYNQVSDLTPLAGLTNLTFLSLEGNQVSDLTPLAGLTNLSWLYLYDNQISDIAPLVANVGLDAGDVILLGNNPLSSESCTTHIPELEARGVWIGHYCPASDD